MPCGRHISGNKTTTKILQAGFPTLFKDVHIMSGLTTVVKGPKIDQGEMKCPFTTFLQLRSSMFGVWISWNLFDPPKAINIS